jgi:hypothetical protein
MGVVVAVAVMLAVERAVVMLVDTPLGRSQGIKALTIGIWTLALLGLGLLVLRDRPRPAEMPGRLVAIWRDPPGGWVPFALGAILTVPLLAFYAPSLFWDSDSARLVAAIRHVQSGGGVAYFTETQEPYLPHVLLGPVVAVRGVAAAKLAAIVAVQVLAGVVGYVTYRLTRHMLAAGAAVLALLALSPLFARVVVLPMYPTALTLGYLGGWLGYRALTEGDGLEWRLLVPAGVCLALAPEAHGTGQLFLAVPALLVVLAPDLRRGVRNATAMYVVILACSVPRIVINLWDGGLSHVTSTRTDYWITEGYLVEIQRGFWDYEGVTEGIPEFLARLPGRFTGSLGGQAWVVLLLACLGWLVSGHGRVRWFVAATAGFLVVAVTVKRIPPFPRYFAPIWPGLAILAAVGVAWLWAHRAKQARALAALASSALVVAAAFAFITELDDTEAIRGRVEALPLRAYAAAIDDGKGVIGARSHQGLVNVDADIRTWGDQFLTEEEYVTFLTWPSDEAVIDLMERHDIGWVFIDRRRVLEGPYNDTWLEPSHGLEARHVERVGTSPNFCRWIGRPGDFVLFRLGPCPGG